MRGLKFAVHAAAGDTTWEGYGTLTGAANFNPRIREGCDKLDILAAHNKEDFNPRIREGCDNLSKPLQRRMPNFNPRIREGCDER